MRYFQVKSLIVVLWGLIFFFCRCDLNTLNGNTLYEDPPQEDPEAEKKVTVPNPQDLDHAGNSKEVIPNPLYYPEGIPKEERFEKDNTGGVRVIMANGSEPLEIGRNYVKTVYGTAKLVRYDREKKELKPTPQPVTANLVLRPGDTLDLVQKGEVEIVLADGTLLNLHSEAILTIDGSASAGGITLSAGNLFVAVPPHQLNQSAFPPGKAPSKTLVDEHPPFRVYTPVATVRGFDVKFRIAVAADGASRIAVVKGTAEVEAAGRKIVLKEREEILIEPGKTPPPPLSGYIDSKGQIQWDQWLYLKEKAVRGQATLLAKRFADTVTDNDREVRRLHQLVLAYTDQLNGLREKMAAARQDGDQDRYELLKEQYARIYAKLDVASWQLRQYTALLNANWQMLNRLYDQAVILNWPVAVEIRPWWSQVYALSYQGVPVYYYWPYQVNYYWGAYYWPWTCYYWRGYNYRWGYRYSPTVYRGNSYWYNHYHSNVYSRNQWNARWGNYHNYQYRQNQYRRSAYSPRRGR